MPQPKVPDDVFVRDFEALGARKFATKHGMRERDVYSRRVRLENKLKRQITPPPDKRNTRRNVAHPQRIDVEIKDGVILVGSDAHYYPGDPSVAHCALIKFCKKFSPRVVVLNGDVIDAGTISRFPAIGWENKPKLVDEIGAAQKRTREIKEASPGADLIWTLGNHDGRFETRLATVAPEYAGVYGVHLKDHFPDFLPCWSVWVNPEKYGAPVIKHRFKGGIHATHNNTMWAGRTIITGHLHSLKVTPFTDYNGTRWGVDTGTMADIYGPQFTDYLEDNPRNWRSGLAVLTFKDGELLDPELVRVWDEKRIVFRGELINV